MTFSALILLILKVSIVLNVLALGLAATFADAIYLLHRPRELARSFLSMNVVMPFVAFILVTMFNLDPAVKIALVAVSVSPVPPLFPKKASKVCDKENYGVGLLVSAAILAIIVIPVTMAIFERLFDLPLAMPVSSITKLVSATVLLPLLAGIAIRRFAPSFAERAARPLGVTATLLLIFSCVPVLVVSAKTILSLIGNGTVLGFSVFAMVGLIIGHLLGGPEPEHRGVLALATATRHPGIAVALANANFPEQKLAVPAVLLYVIIATILSALYPRVMAHRGTAPTETPKHVAA
jgi:bile acid:Na+ symporter, BASS family